MTREIKSTTLCPNCKVGWWRENDYGRYECGNCGYTRPHVHRRPRAKTKTEYGDVTRGQAKTLEFLRREIFRQDSHGSPDEYEYKQFEVHPSIHGTLLVTEVGRRGDEGTMGCILCRSRRIITIGPRGSLTADAKGMEKVTGSAALFTYTDTEVKRKSRKKRHGSLAVEVRDLLGRK